MACTAAAGELAALPCTVSQAGAHVGDGVGDEEGGDLLVALLHHVLHAVLEHRQPAHARPYEHACLGLVHALHGNQHLTLRLCSQAWLAWRTLLHAGHSCPSCRGRGIAQPRHCSALSDSSSSAVSPDWLRRCCWMPATLLMLLLSSKHHTALGDSASTGLASNLSASAFWSRPACCRAFLAATMA